MKPLGKTISFELLPECRQFLQQRAEALGLSQDNPDHIDCILNETIQTTELQERARKNFPTMKYTMKYILLDQNHQPKACGIQEWAEWQKTDPDISVDHTIVGDAAIGTKFISILAHEYAPCWETNVVGGIYHGLREVCSGNREQAEQMHAMVVRRVKNATQHSADEMSR